MKTVALLALITPASAAGVTLPDLQSKGLNPRAARKGQLEECQGDCDSNGHCKGHLKCWQRHDYSAIPGCKGRGGFTWDYCYDPVKKAQREAMARDYTSLKNYGWTPIGSVLGKCVGDCDHNGHCKGDLVCKQRDSNEKVVGCSGVGASGVDFCYDPKDELREQMKKDHSAPKNYGWTPIGNILGKCVGDCDHNGHCRGGLQCMQRGSQRIPGCPGSADAHVDYCYDPLDQAREEMAKDHSSLKNYGWTPVGNVLGKCVGDCDNNGHCRGGLKCWHRNANEKVPGCSGSATAILDYCYDPADLAADHGKLTNYGWTPSGSPLGKCVGDCDHDGHCTGNLVCQQRDGNENVHGCSGSAVYQVDYCVERTKNPTKSPTTSPTASPTASPTKNPTMSPTASPTESPTESPTPRCHSHNCMNWNCADWCECYNEDDEAIYASLPGCQDDGDDSCVCFQEEDDEFAKQIHHGTTRHDKIHYRQYQKHKVVCGRHNPRECKEADRVETDPTAKHEVRCCSSVEPTKALTKLRNIKNCNNPHHPGPSVAKVGYTLPGIEGVWGMSKVGNTGNKCVHAATFDEAKQICAAIPNGRLCTEKEVKNECASWTGCGHDADLIWVTYMHGVDTRE